MNKNLVLHSLAVGCNENVQFGQVSHIRNASIQKSQIFNSMDSRRKQYGEHTKWKNNVKGRSRLHISPRNHNQHALLLAMPRICHHRIMFIDFTFGFGDEIIEKIYIHHSNIQSRKLLFYVTQSSWNAYMHLKIWIKYSDVFVIEQSKLNFPNSLHCSSPRTKTDFDRGFFHIIVLRLCDWKNSIPVRLQPLQPTTYDNFFYHTSS